MGKSRSIHLEFISVLVQLTYVLFTKSGPAQGGPTILWQIKKLRVARTGFVERRSTSTDCLSN